MARNGWKLPRFFDRKALPRKVSHTPRHKVLFEALEPRILLSADLYPGAAGALASGLDQFDDRLEGFLDGNGQVAEEVLLNTHLPFLLQVQETAEGAEQVAPTIGGLFAVQVDGNGPEDGGINATLAGLDQNHGNGDGVVDAGEFIRGWLFDPVESLLNDINDSDLSTNYSTSDLKTQLEAGVYDHTLDLGNGTIITFTIGTIDDLSEGLNDPSTGTEEHLPAGNVAWYIPFQLKVSQNLAIDLGLEADAFKLVPFDRAQYDSNGEIVTPTIPVDATIDFGFTFGVNIGGQDLPGQDLTAADFFIRSADDLSVSITSDVSGFDSLLNIGFLGAEITNGTIHFRADVITELVDPDSPDVLGFTEGQYDFRYDSGTITAMQAIPEADLDHAAQFTLRIGNLGIATEVTVADNNRSTFDDGSRESGDYADDLLDDVNAALAAANLDDLITASITVENKLQFTLVSTSGTPLGFANESFGVGSIAATPDGDYASSQYEYLSDQVFLLSVGGGLPQLVTVHFPDTAKEEIGFGYSQEASLIDKTIVAADVPSLFDVTAAATFTVTATTSGGAQHVQSFTITPDETDGFVNAADLAALIDGKLNATLTTLVQVGTTAGKLRFSAIDGTVAFRLQASGTATSELRFAPDAQVTLTLTANDDAISSGDLSRTATFDVTMTTVGSGTTTTRVSVAPDAANNDVADLAFDIDAALASHGLAIDAIAVGSKIVLVAQNVNISAFDVKAYNQTIDDLVDDVNLALENAGFDTVTAGKSLDGTQLILTEADGKTLEITRTISLDAGITYAELQTPVPDETGADPASGTATADLFHAEQGGLSNIRFNLPVHVLPGLEDASTALDDNYNPINLAIVGNFDPFGTNAQDGFDHLNTHRFNLTLDVNPDGQTDYADDGTLVEVAPIPVPASIPLNDPIQLVNFAEPLNFNLVTAESMIGLLRSLGSALQEIAGSAQFALYDIPFADASLSDLVYFDQLIETALIYDVGNDGVFNDDPLVNNAASGDESLLLERTITGYGESGTVERLPSFKTAQELADRLKVILAVTDMEGVGGINPTYDPRSNELTYDVELLSDARVSVGVPDLSDPDAEPPTDPPTVDPVPDPFEVPFEFDVDLSPFNELTVDKTVAEGLANVRLQAHSGLSMTFGVDLSPPGAVIYDSTPIGDLNGGSGIDIKLEQAVTGEAGVRSVLTSDAHIFLDLDVLSPVWLTIEKEATYDNKTTQDFANDINDVLDDTYDADGWNVGYFVNASVKDGRLALTAVNGAESLVVYANSYKDDSGQYVDSAWTQLGFSVVAVSGKTVSAIKAPTPAVGRLSSDTSFWVDIDNDGLDLYEVTMKAAATAANMTMSDLVADVDNALAATDIGNDLGFTAYQTVTLEPLAVTGTSAAVLYFTADVTFNVAINGESPVPVTVKSYAYSDIDELVSAVNDGLADAGLSSLIVAEASGDRIAVRALDTSTTELEVTAAPDNDLGFGVSQTVALDLLALTAPFVAHLELADDMHIAVGLDDGSTFTITIADGAYADIYALVAAINTGLTTFGLDTQVVAVALDDPHTPATDERIISLQAQDFSVVRIAVEEGSRFLSSLIKADYDMSPTLGSRLVLSAVDNTTEFWLSGGGPTSQLGLPNSALSNQADFVIFDRTGTPHEIVLDGLDLTDDAVDIDVLMGLIYDQTGHAVSLEFNATHTGLRLVDQTAGTGLLRVMTVNGCGALLQLGFLNTFNTNDPDYIEGGPIGLTHLDGRFFVKDAEIRAEGIRMDTPLPDVGVDGTALFGMVGLDINVQGTVFAEMSAQLQAAGGAPGSQVILADLLAGTKYGVLQYNTETMPFTVGAILGGSESHAQALIIADDPMTNTLTLKMLSGRFLDGEYISAGDAVASADGGFSTIVADPVVAKAREISYTDQTGNFAPGTMLTGADSGATAIILADDDNGGSGTLTVYHINGSFLEGEIITDDLSGSATAHIAVASEEAFAQLSYNTQTADFTVGSVLTGAGGATALILADADAGDTGTLTLKVIDGTFVTSEIITDTDGGSATAGTWYEKDVTRLVYADKTSEFTINTFIDGDDSLAKAFVIADSGNTLTLVVISGTFADGETISGGGGSAIVDGSLPTKANFGEFVLGIDVQDGFDGLGFGDGFNLLNGAHYDVDFALSAFGNPFDPAPPVADFYNLYEDIGDLAAFEHLGYADLATALNGLLTLLEDVEDNFALFKDPIPAINKSVSDLLSLVSGFTQGVNNANGIFDAAIAALDPENIDLPALTLQGIPNVIRGAFGLDPDGVDAEGDPAPDWVKLSFDKSNNMLLMDLSLHESITTKLGLDITLLDEDGNPILDQNGEPLPNLTSGGVLKVSGTLDIDFSVGINLAEPDEVYLFDTSSIAADLHVEGEGQTYSGGEAGMGLYFRASLGPLAVFIQDGIVLIDEEFSLGLDFSEGGGRKLLSNVAFADFEAPNVTADATNVVLPMFFGGEGPNNYIRDFKASGDLAGVAVEMPQFSSVVAAIGAGTIEVDPFDNIMLAFDTLNFYLEGLSDIVADEVLGVNLPLVGEQLADILFIETFRNTLYTTLKNGVANAINPDPDTFIQSLLTGPGGLFATGGLLEDYYLPGSLQYDDNMGETDVVWDWFRQWDFTLRRENKTYIIDNFDLGIFNFDFDIDAPVTVEMSWWMDIGFGVNFVEGAYVNVSGFDQDDVDIKLDLTISLPDGGTYGGTFGFLPLDVTDPGNDSGVRVNFFVNILNDNTSAVPGHLGFSDLGNLTQQTDIEGRPLDGATDAVTLQLVTQALLGLPSLSTDLVIDWSLLPDTSTDPDTRYDLSDLYGDAVAPGITLIALNDMTLDAGSVAESLLGPLFEDVMEFIEPFMPVIDTLTYPIPILSDVAGEPFTLLDLAAIFGSVDPSFIESVADILDVISSINDFMTAPDLPLGSLILYQYDQLGDVDPETGTVEIGNFIPNDQEAPISHLDDIGVVLGLGGWTFDQAAYDAAIDSNDFLKDVRDGNLADGLTMPLLTDPTQAVKLLLDQDAVMIDYLLPPLSVEFEYLQLFPIFGPLSLSIEISFGFSLDLHSVGFDTNGYHRYADGGFRNVYAVFDGFYLNDLDKDQVDAPEITFEFGLVGAAELNLGIARAGVEGGIKAKILFDWYDAYPDGRVHISEMANSILVNDGNPIAVFDVGGALTFQMSAFLEISIIGFELPIPITPETTLYDFEIDFDRPAILATQADGTLILNMGPNAEDRLVGNTSDGNEGIEVTIDGSTVSVTSTMFGVSDPQVFTGIDEIVGIGGEGNDSIKLTYTSNSNVRYTLEGGNGDDVLEVAVTSGNGGGGGTIRGGAGNDTLAGGGGDDIIYGEEGIDTIDGGAGYDILFGDFGRVFENIADPDPLVTSRVTDADGNDTISGGADDDIIIGGGGDDILNGDAGNDVIIGDGGRFAFLDDPNGHFNILSVTPVSYTNYVRPGIATYIPPDQISDDIDAVYNDLMAIFSATDLGFGGNDTISGGENNDIILGGSADDNIAGDGGADIILAGKGFDEVRGGDGDDFIFGGDQADTISGDGNHDVISGGSGNDYIHGNTGDDVMKGDSGADIMFGDQGDDLVFGQTEPDILFGGANDDLVVGGTSNDIMFGDDGLVAKLYPEYDPDTDLDSAISYKSIFNETLIDQSIVDGLLAAVQDQEGDSWWDDDLLSLDLIRTYVTVDDGNDYLSGDADDDMMFGGGGNDLMGGDVDPRLPNAGVDTAISEDVLIGDGGMITFNQRFYRSIATVIEPDEVAVDPGADDKFDDTIYGDNGNDYIFGGWGNDYLFGGHGKVVTGGVVGDSRGETDNEASDNDIILGDNGEILFADETIEANFGIKELIRTTDEANDTGGHDYAEGELGNDVIFGGVNGSVDVLIGNAGDDVILGDNGELDFAYGTDTNLDTLDLIRSYRDGLGGTDIVSGKEGGDVLIGGTDGDEMYGDDAAASSGVDDGEDIMLGDNADIWMLGTEGRLTVQVAEMTTGTAIYLITTTDAKDFAHPTKAAAEACGGPDTMSGNAGNDIMLGGVNNDDGNFLNGIEKDMMYGDREGVLPGDMTIAYDGDDILLGDNGLLSFCLDPVVLTAAGAPDFNLVADVTFDIAINYEAAVTVTVASGSYSDLTGLLEAINAALVDADLDPLLLAEASGDFVALRAIDPGVAKIAVEADADNELGFAEEQEIESGSGLNVLDLIRSFEDGLGGVDTLSGNKGLDVAIGGTAGDTIYGDDDSASAEDDDLADLLLGDNADIFLTAAPTSGDGFDLKTVLDAAVKTIRTTDTIDPASTGGADTISGNAKGDIIAGGVYGDTLYGDRQIPNATTEANEGDDIILGDNGAFEWLSSGRLDEIEGIDLAANNPDLVSNDGNGWPDGDLTTLDLVTTEQPTSGGRDLICGDEGRDFVFGGTDSDEIYGDDGNYDEEPDSSNNDLLFGDHGRLYPQFSTLRSEGQDWRLAFNSRNFFAIDTGDSGLLISDGGEGDRMWGEEGDDTMLGQQGDDRMWGGAGDDDMTGGHNVSGGYDELSAPAITATLNPPVNDLMDGGTGDDSMAGDNAIIWRRGDDLSPRFRELTEDSIYTTTAATITANIDSDWQSDPADAIGRDIQLVDHSDAVQIDPQGRFGNDVMAGGADSDVMFGELGNDLMQGDGEIMSLADDGAPVADPFISRQIDMDDSGDNPDTDDTLYFNIPEQSGDADDYLEGNGGSDLMYGGLGQDDLIGGSSALFGLRFETDPASENYALDPEGEYLRPDMTDYIFGGAGIATDRNDIGATETESLASEDAATHVITTAANGHARDADYIMGDNANVYRLTGTKDYDGNGTASYGFLQFNYDTYGSLKIISRAMQQLDYTLGGVDYAGGTYTAWDAANADNGAADLIHGESGDDIIFGMTGSDVLFGEGQDDDIVGGYGHDWISGGTGQDGILGDDGLIRTSRNSTAGEPLNGVAELLAKDPQPKYAGGNVLDEVIATPGSIQYAVINLEGELKKTADLVPFSFDSAWNADDDEFPDNQNDSPLADDIIFGGLGTDWLHGGSGDDAISGAEALEQAYVPDYDDVDGDGVTAELLDLGYFAVDLIAGPIIPGETTIKVFPGDVLAFNPVDVLTDHTNNRDRAGEFALYDEYDPRRTILLTPTGELYKGSTDPADATEGVDYFQFLLNFDESEGVERLAGTVPKATGQQTESYPTVYDDGKDAIFGDLGNDWLVGGTGRDNIYGGWGNDLLNADDDHDGHEDVNNLNDFTDTHPYYEDRAYGGAGRDVLIGNTGGDRLIDWVGEYNSYLVPYAPFGQASVSRTLQPFLPEFLYALSAGDGADPTRFNDTGADQLRNGEPDAEMGLVLQKDFAWQAQTGAPADPQAGNIPGGARDVLRSATFNDGTTQGFVADSGKWSLKYGVFYVEPTVLGTDAVSVWFHDQVVPSYFEITATVNPVKPIAGYKANAYIVFDYYGPDDFKFAGLNSSTNKIEIGQRTSSGWQVLTSINMLVKAGTNYNLLVALNGTTATIVVNNGLTLSYAFTPHLDVYGLAHNINEGMIGLGADNAKASIDNVSLRILPPTITLTRTDDFSTEPLLIVGETGSWTVSKGYYVGAPAVGEMLALAGGSLTIGPSYLLQLEAKITTKAVGGIIFDQYDVDDFKWAVYSKATNQILLGHYTARDGWVIDKAVSKVLSGEVTLALSLKGTTVSVMVNGTAALSYVYNAVVTDGGYGLLAKDGTVSFNSFTLKSDDPALAQLPALPTATLTAAEPAPLSSEPVAAIDTVPAELVEAAKAYWRGVLGVEAAAALNRVNVETADLSGLFIGQVVGNTIQVDLDAAGYGWFVDETPEDSVEFLRRGGHGRGTGHDTFLATKQSAAVGQMDLLTVLIHEMGHILEFGHDSSWSVMDGDLDAGTRILPKKAASVAAPGKAISMTAREELPLDEEGGAFREQVHEAVEKWADERLSERGGMLLADRQRKEESCQSV